MPDAIPAGLAFYNASMPSAETCGVMAFGELVRPTKRKTRWEVRSGD
jgi:hypothetical protein